MAQRRLHGLERVLGVNALFSTAYGNVGSSIYYALGLVASFALGLTPLVFVIAGDLLPDRRDLRRGDGDVPGGGRLVELRPPRLQRVLVLLRRLGPDAQLRHHDLDLGVLRAPLHRRAVLGAAAARAGESIGGIVVVAVLAGSTSSASRRRPGSTSCWRSSTSPPSCWVLLGLVLVFSPEPLIDNVDFGIAPTWSNFIARDPDRR